MSCKFFAFLSGNSNQKQYITESQVTNITGSTRLIKKTTKNRNLQTANTGVPPKLQISVGSALSNRDNRLSSQGTFTYTILIKPGAENNTFKPTVTRQHLPEFGGYSLPISFQLRSQRKQMKEKTYIYIYSSFTFLTR